MWKFTTVLGIFICVSFRNVSTQTLKGVTVQNQPYVFFTNDGQIEGFSVDLMNEICGITGLNYTLEFTPDGNYGYIVKNTVNGMVGEVYSNRADFAIADLIVTERRKQFVDFTEPFIETKLTILIHKDNANNINSFSDLADQTDIEYGILQWGSTYHYFSESSDPTIQKLFQHMTNNSDNFVRSLMEGVDKMYSNKYALIVHNTFAEYIVGFYCGLTYIDDQNNYFPQQYAIALNKNSTYTEQFNSAIRQLKRRGQIDRLRNRYWKKCGVLNGVTVFRSPYIEPKGDSYEGFGVDLLNAISGISGLQYTLDIQFDGRYAQLENGNIVGMIGEVYNKRADFAIADLTVTDFRKQYVEFTEPFIETGLAILIHKNNAINIRSFRDLSNQETIKYGPVYGGSTHKFFSQSNDSTISQMYRKMSEDTTVFFNNMVAGLDRVKTTPFAMIVETSFAEYAIGIDCQLTYIVDRNHFYPRQYAIALPKNSIYLDQFNCAIRHLKTSGQIEVFKNRYWKRCGVLSGVTIKAWPLADLWSGIEGFVVDLMKEISYINGIEYSLYFTPDYSYGYVENNSINGMLGEVWNGRAEFAVADIIITEIRRQFVDFTEPFIETGLAILIHKDNANNISSFADLADQTAVKYGLIRKGSTFILFNQSSDPTFQKMYRQMIETPDVLINYFNEGIHRVKTTPFAFIVEKTLAELVIGNNCELTLIDDQNNYDRRQFAIALPKNSIHLEKFNSAIRQLKSSGSIDAIKDRYWKKCGVLRGATLLIKPYSQIVDGKIEGFARDLLNEISSIKGFNYTLYLTPDGKYGVPAPIPDGLIGQLYRNLADFAVADLTVTDQRKQFVDFTEPFIETGLTIIINRNNANNITSFSDLLNQNEIKYGVVHSGTTYFEFARSSDPTISQMFKKMSENPTVFVGNYKQGLERVNTTRFAFIAERAFAEYITGEDCQFTYIDDPVHRFPRQYAIAMPKNSTYIPVFNSAINELKSNGVLTRLKNNYWKKCEQ